VQKTLGEQMPALELASTCSTKRFEKQRRREREMRSAGSMLGPNGFFGLAHNDIQVGDSLWLIYGARVPFIVRPSRNAGNIKLHQLVCEAYVHGAMNGEAMKMKAVKNATLYLE
jgi:hypothetical protein